MNRMWVRLSLAFSLVIFIGVLLINAATFYLVRTGTILPVLTESLGQPDGLVRILAQHYEVNDSWDNVGSILVVFNNILPDFPEQGVAYLTMMDAAGTVIYDPSLLRFNQRISLSELEDAFPIEVDGRIRGYVQVRFENLLTSTDTFRPLAIIPFQFISRVLISVVSVAGIAGIIIGVLVSRSLTAPLQQLAEGVRAFGRQNLTERITVQGTTEIQAVSQAFNEMADELQGADERQRHFLADVAHELRTPLSVLWANLQAIQDGIYDASADEIQKLLNQTAFLHQLVEDLHQLAQADTKRLKLNLNTINLKHLLENILAQFKIVAAQKDIALINHFPDEDIQIEADSVRISQVIHNLLQNAANYSEVGGKIEVRMLASANEVVLSIQDNGIGIPSDKLPYIFDRFYRTDESRTRSTGGAGLGLAIAKAIVELHGGTIHVASSGTTTEGTRFDIHLPRPIVS